MNNFTCFVLIGQLITPSYISMSDSHPISEPKSLSRHGYQTQPNKSSSLRTLMDSTISFTKPIDTITVHNSVRCCDGAQRLLHNLGEAGSKRAPYRVKLGTVKFSMNLSLHVTYPKWGEF